jgi:hypothetical protein
MEAAVGRKERAKAARATRDAALREDDGAGSLEVASEPVPGRLVTLAGLSLAVGAVPLPFVPDRLLLQVRGALVHETLARHGVAVSGDARRVLARPSSGDRVRELLRSGAEFLAKRLLRRVGPFGPLSAAVSAFEVYALGRLLDRYVREVRPAGAPPRLLEPEAERVRAAIDAAVRRVVHPSTTSPRFADASPAEDLRDEFTRWLDAVILTGASLPGWLVGRLDAAFDEVVRQHPELVELA